MTKKVPITAENVAHREADARRERLLEAQEKIIVAVLDLAATGMTADAIAETLGIPAARVRRIIKDES